jgi:CheY-like chemotaxis protein
LSNSAWAILTASAKSSSGSFGLTGYGQAQDRRRSQEAGFDHHLVKPVDPDALQGVLLQEASARQDGGAV